MAFLTTMLGQRANRDPLMSWNGQKVETGQVETVTAPQVDDLLRCGGWEETKDIERAAVKRTKE